MTRRTVFPTLYVMNTKLTLRVDEILVQQAKTQAARQGKSVSQLFSEFITSLESCKTEKRVPPPITSALLGILKNAAVSEEDYRRHLMEKHS